MNIIQLHTPDIDSLKQRAGHVLAEASVLVIDSNDMYEIAVEHTKVIKLLAQAVEEKRKAITKPLDDAKKAAMDFFRPFSEQCAQAESTLKQKIATYTIEQERKRRLAEEQALQEAEEVKRQEEESLLAAAEEAAKTGDTETSQRLMAEASTVSMIPTIAIPENIEQPKAKGVTIKDNWTGEIVNFDELVCAAAARPELRELLLPNLPSIRKMAKALKEAANIPGVRVFNDPTVSVRT